MNKTTKIRKKTVLFAVTTFVGFAKNQRYVKKNFNIKTLILKLLIVLSGR